MAVGADAPAAVRITEAPPAGRPERARGPPGAAPHSAVDPASARAALPTCLVDFAATAWGHGGGGEDRRWRFRSGPFLMIRAGCSAQRTDDRSTRLARHSRTLFYCLPRHLRAGGSTPHKATWRSGHQFIFTPASAAKVADRLNGRGIGTTPESVIGALWRPCNSWAGFWPR